MVHRFCTFTKLYNWFFPATFDTFIVFFFQLIFVTVESNTQKGELLHNLKCKLIPLKSSQ